MSLDAQIEALLFYNNEPMQLTAIAKLLNTSEDTIIESIHILKQNLENRGLVLIENDSSVLLSTSPEASELIKNLRKDELSKDLGKAGLETLTIILYKGPASKRQIDYIRGVNSGSILRNLLIRGLIEKVEQKGERSFTYQATFELLQYMGITQKEDLPEYEEVLQKLNEYVEIEESQDHS